MKKKTILEALEKAAGIKITFEDIKGSAKGYYNTVEGQIVIKSGMSDNQTLKTALHV